MKKPVLYNTTNECQAKVLLIYEQLKKKNHKRKLMLACEKNKNKTNAVEIWNKPCLMLFL